MTQTYISIVIFQIIFMLLCYLIGDRLPIIQSNWYFPLLALASFRGGRAIADNEVFAWLRAIVGITIEKDTSGAGDSVVANGHGLRLSLAQMISCPICAGTWFALALLLVSEIAPGMGRALIYILAAAGIVEILICLSEYLGWGGRAAREIAGSHWLKKNGNDTNKKSAHRLMKAAELALIELDRIGSDIGFEPDRYQERITALDKLSRSIRLQKENMNDRKI